jgi:hypothetical protein
MAFIKIRRVHLSNSNVMLQLCTDRESSSEEEDTAQLLKNSKKRPGETTDDIASNPSQSSKRQKRSTTPPPQNLGVNVGDLFADTEVTQPTDCEALLGSLPAREPVSLPSVHGRAHQQRPATNDEVEAPSQPINGQDGVATGEVVAPQMRTPNRQVDPTPNALMHTLGRQVVLGASNELLHKPDRSAVPESNELAQTPSRQVILGAFNELQGTHPSTPIVLQVMDVAQSLGGVSPQNLQIAAMMVTHQQNMDMQLANLRNEHDRTIIAGMSVVSGTMQHRDSLEQKDSHHEAIMESTVKQHRDTLQQKDSHHEAIMGSTEKQHRDTLEQEDSHHDARMEYKERDLADAAVTRCANGHCGFGTLYSIFALALGANYHLRGLMDDPCLYLEQTSPISHIPWTSWIPWGSQYASCFFSVIWICSLFGVYSAMIACLPTRVKFSVSTALHLFAIFKILMDTANLVIGVALSTMIIPPGLMFVWRYFYLYEKLDKAQSAAKMKYARLHFEKVVKFIMLSQFTFVLTCFAVLVFKESSGPTRNLKDA